ncbi:MAG: PepSY domain-containing protein [Stellaceae bacterium]
MRRAALLTTAILALMALPLVAHAAQPRKPAAPAGVDRTAQKLTQQLAQRYGVQVLRADRELLDGKPVYRMVVMNAGGDFNEAYAVHTLVVDAASGALVSQFQHAPAGYALAASPDRTPRDDGSGVTIRRATFSKL